MVSRCASLLIIASCLICFQSARAEWDFTLSGAKPAFYYGHYTQLGQNGFFGPYDVDLSLTGDFAPLNGWVGNSSDVNFLTAGTDAAISSLVLVTDARLTGDWVEARGRYYINPYVTSTTQGAYVAVSPGQLATWSVVAKLPVFLIGYGKQDFSKGLMLQFGSSRTKEYFILERGATVPNLLGRMVGSGWLPAGVLRYFDRGGRWEVTTRPEANDPPISDELTALAKDVATSNGNSSTGPEPWGNTRLVRTAYYEPGHLAIGLGFMPWEKILLPGSPATAVSWNLNDINAASFRNVIGYLKYYSGDMSAEIGTLHIRTHQGPELQQTTARRLNTPTKEIYTTEGWFDLQYNNGRWFLGAELDWFNRIWRFQRSQSGLFQNPDDPAAPVLPEFMTDLGSDLSGRSRFAPQYWESWRFMVQGGVYCGPGSLRLFYAYLPGQDRRHGIVIDRQPFIQEPDQAALGLFDPYSMLMSYLYGSGVQAQTYINAASVYAVKLDYMLAANLILECSVLTARRTSDGYGLGYVRPNTVAGKFGQVNYGVQGTFVNPAPGIPENDLGWELMGSVLWKLVELDTQNWTIEARASYWRPGKWFNYACTDRSVPNWDTPGPGNNWGVNPDREIDPVVGFELRVGASM